jgi:hypothetical protein
MTVIHERACERAGVPVLHFEFCILHCALRAAGSPNIRGGYLQVGRCDSDRRASNPIVVRATFTWPARHERE